MRLPPARLGSCLLVVLLWSLASGNRLAAQTTGGDLPVRDSGVGYIDCAIPGNVLRLRFDDAFGNNNPSRGEFFWARGAPGGPGVPLPERTVDYQDIMGSVEVLLGEHCSVFAEVPVRFLNPEVNANTAGLSDVNAGIKVAVVHNEDCTLSLLFRAYAPTGDPHRGLGDGHVSLEPGVLWFVPLSERLALEGELTCWIPVGVDGFASDVLRYGLGLEYRLWQDEHFRVTPVVEAVGWTFVNGADPFVEPSGIPVVESAAGQTIFSLKLGMRFGLGEHIDLYGGYSRPLTGDRFYENSFRLEMRFVF